MSETPVETILRAAAKMRKQAKAVDMRDYERVTRKVGRLTTNGQHIESWSPVVALRISDWLDRVAEDAADSLADVDEFESARDIARAYLGEAS